MMMMSLWAVLLLLLLTLTADPSPRMRFAHQIRHNNNTHNNGIK
jgi:hypothetical protein